MAEYLDHDGLAYFWEKVKGYCDNKGEEPEVRNLLLINDFTYTTDDGVTYSASGGVVTVSGTPTKLNTYNIISGVTQPTLPAGTYTLYLGAAADCNRNPGGYMWVSGLKTFTTDAEWKLAQIQLYCDTSNQNYTIYPMLLSGEYTEATLPEFVPYGQSEATNIKPVLLWSGTWSSGTLTIATSGGSAGCTGKGNISDYKWVRIERGDMVSFDAPVYSDGLYFGGVWGNSDGVGQLNVGHIRRSGNVLTYYYNTRFALTSFVAQASGEAITAIYGLAKTSDIS